MLTEEDSYPRRFSMLIEDGKVKKLHEEPDGTGVSCSLADTILEDLDKQK
jgi:peroxiredoxin 5